jgi:hypothetical protein
MTEQDIAPEQTREACFLVHGETSVSTKHAILAQRKDSMRECRGWIKTMSAGEENAVLVRHRVPDRDTTVIHA